MRRTKVMAALVGLVTGLFTLALGPVASAQTGYPPGPCTITVGSLDVGTVTVGQHFVIQVAPTCVFTVGASITVTVNGANIPGKVANANGFVLVDVTVISATQLSIDDPVITPAVCGVNTVTASGPSPTASGGVATQTATFTLTCPTAVPLASASTPATPIQSRLSLTGANTLRFVAIALALVGGGSLALVATRRRRAF